MHLDPTNPQVRGDEQKLQQVLLNLLVNAESSMQSAPVRHLTITTRRKQEMVHIVVSDTGHGMSPSVSERVFEPFFTTKPQRAGLGLGLTICEHIVLQAGGAIVAQNVGDGAGEGALFTVRLPAATAAA